MTYTCRSANQVVYQRNLNSGASGPWGNCRRAGGVVKIWRYPNPSPYGSTVFQTACNDRVFIDYKNSAASYAVNQRVGQAVAWILSLLSGNCLGRRIIRRVRHHRTHLVTPEEAKG